MADQHRATPEQWATARVRANDDESFALSPLICELADRLAAAEQRIRALEGDCPAVATPDDKPQTLHTVALDMVDTLGRSFNVLPVILDTLRRAIREPMEPTPAPTIKPPELSDIEMDDLWMSGNTHESGRDALRRIHRAGWDAALAAVEQQPPAPCPHLRSSDEGTSYCALSEEGMNAAVRRIDNLRAALREVITICGGLALEGVSDDFLCKAPDEVRVCLAKAQPTTETAPPAPAPAGSLVEVVTGSHMQCSPEIACAAIRAVADWLESQNVGAGRAAARWMREEADR